MLCTDCNGHFCAGVSGKSNPQGHARIHSTQNCHWVALWYNEPFDGHCFMCAHALNFTQSDVKEDEGGTGNGGDKGKDEVRDDASELANGDGYVIRGIPNLGFTCYMSALVQCLLALGKLRKRMLGPDAPSGLVGASLKDFFVETSIANYGRPMVELKPRRLLQAIQDWDPGYVGMQDSHELFLSLCACLDNEDRNKLPSMEGGAPSAIVPARTISIFRVRLSITRLCKSCSHKSVSPLVFNHLFAWMPSKDPPATSESQIPGSELRDASMGNAPKTVQVDCTEMKICQSKEVVHGPLQTQNKVAGSLDKNFEGVDGTTSESHHSGNINSVTSIVDGLISYHFREEEPEGWKCEDCGSVEGIRTTVISELPPVLIVHVLRYDQEGNKLSGHVSFEEILDVGSFMDPSCEDKEKSSYRLVGVVEHLGPYTVQGHYVAYVRAGHKQQSSGSSSWFRADDSVIREVCLEDVFRCEAFLLFYERITPTEASSGSKKTRIHLFSLECFPPADQREIMKSMWTSAAASVCDAAYRKSLGIELRRDKGDGRDTAARRPCSIVLHWTVKGRAERRTAFERRWDLRQQLRARASAQAACLRREELHTRTRRRSTPARGDTVPAAPVAAAVLEEQQQLPKHGAPMSSRLENQERRRAKKKAKLETAALAGQCPGCHNRPGQADREPTLHICLCYGCFLANRRACRVCYPVEKELR